MKKINFIILFLVLISFIMSAYFFPLMPETIATHWNFAGDADGFMPKFWGLFLMPIMLVFFVGLFWSSKVLLNRIGLFLIGDNRGQQPVSWARTTPKHFSCRYS